MSISLRRSSIVLLFAAALAAPIAAAAGLQVTLKNNTDAERASQQQLARLSSQYDLSRWTQTSRIIFEQKVIPHSHPVLTLNTRHLDDDGLFLSTFIHEQTHWLLDRQPRQTRRAVRALMKRYPTLPVGYPDGAESLGSSYEHLLVIYLELEGVEALLGESERQRIQHYWTTDHYKKLYDIVGRDREHIGAAARNAQLRF